MPMSSGAVDRTSINPTTGAASGTGYALDHYNFLVGYNAALGVPPAAPTAGSESPPYSAASPCTPANVAALNAGRLKQFQFWADQANAYAHFVSYMQTNAKAHVSVESLGRIPGTIATGQAIDAPASPVDIPIT